MFSRSQPEKPDQAQRGQIQGAREKAPGVEESNDKHSKTKEQHPYGK